MDGQAEGRLPAFRPIKYFALFCVNFEFTQIPGYTLVALRCIKSTQW